MISKVIFNADDFALTSYVSEGIVKAHREGVVKSTTVLGNCDIQLLEEAQEHARSNPELGFGIHLCLTTRMPLSKDHKTLVNDLGKFKWRNETIDKTINIQEVYEEWKTQIKRAQEYLTLTHFDSHHGVHNHPVLASLAVRLSKEFNLPFRSQREKLPWQVKCDASFYDTAATLETLIQIMSNHDGVLEIMTHPGLDDDDFLNEISSYSTQRAHELEILTSDALQAFIRDNNIEVINYRNYGNTKERK